MTAATTATAAHKAAARQSGDYARREIETAIKHLQRAAVHARRSGDVRLAGRCQNVVSQLDGQGAAS